MSMNPQVKDWRGQRVWIVGASSGIGLALAQKMADLGALVAVSARKQQPLTEFCQQYPHCLALPLDVNHAEQWQNSYQTLKNQWQTLDWLIVCAADYQPMRAWELSASRMSQMMATNYGGALIGIETVLPDMLAHGKGGLAMTASVAGYMGLPKSLSYGPTKAALINLCESLYLDLHPKGLSVSVINPGFIETPLTAQNDFKMPAIISPQQAAEAIVAGLSAGDFEIDFPKRFTTWMKLIKRLPYRLKMTLLAQIEEKS